VTSSDHRKLFSAICIGRMSLKRRVVMAPLTRSRSLQPGDVPGDLMREYYMQRNELLVTEGRRADKTVIGAHAPFAVGGAR